MSVSRGNTLQSSQNVYVALVQPRLLCAYALQTISISSTSGSQILFSSGISLAGSTVGAEKGAVVISSGLRYLSQPSSISAQHLLCLQMRSGRWGSGGHRKGTARGGNRRRWGPGREMGRWRAVHSRYQHMPQTRVEALVITVWFLAMLLQLIVMAAGCERGHLSSKSKGLAVSKWQRCLVSGPGLLAYL